MESVGELAEVQSHILIQNNTCDYHDYGITVHGAADANDSGIVVLANNIVSGAYEYGLNLVDGYMIGVVSNTGYYNNNTNKNWAFSEYDPVEVTTNPYVSDSGYFDLCFLDPNSAFIDAGAEYIEETILIGKTTDVNNFPDSNMTDIGFHHHNWYFSNPGSGDSLSADLDDSLKVDFRDFAILANGWQDTYDINDLSVMANEWLYTVTGHPPISVFIDGDVNNLTGEVGVGVSGCSYSTAQVFIFMDGLLIDQTDYDESEGMPGVIINTPEYCNGSHSIKCAVIDTNDLVTLSENLDVNFSNPLHCSNLKNTYEPNQPLRLLALNSGGNNLQVSIAKWSGEATWSQQTSGDLDITVPGNVLAGQIYDMVVEQEVTDLRDSSWETVWEKAINKEYDPNEFYEFAIFLPSSWKLLDGNSANCRKKAVAGIVRGCETMNIKYVVLYKDQCTWENFAKALVGPKSSDMINVYLVSRGNCRPPYPYYGTEQRTYFDLTDGYVVSNLNTPLGGKWDSSSKVHSMASLGLGGSDKLKLVWIDICFNGKYPDMAAAWMKFYTTTFDKLYVSWDSPIQTSNDSCFSDWTAFFFGYPDPDDGFGLYGANTYYQAWEDACRFNNVCNSAFISTKVQIYGDMNVRFTGDRYD